MYKKVSKPLFIAILCAFYVFFCAEKIKWIFLPNQQLNPKSVSYPEGNNLHEETNSKRSNQNSLSVKMKGMEATSH